MKIYLRYFIAAFLLSILQCGLVLGQGNSNGDDEKIDKKEVVEIENVVKSIAKARAAERNKNRLSGLDASEVEKVVLAKAATYTSDNPNVENINARIEQSSRFYSYREPRLPYFTPVTPIVAGAKEYIDDLNTTMEWYQSLGIKFRVEIGDLQVRQRGAMAVSVGSMKSILTFPDGSEEINPSRWTVVLEKEGGTWLSIHEHLSFYNESEQKNPVVETFKKDLIEFRRKAENK